MKVKFSRCTSSNLANVPQVDGQLIYTKDTNEVYLDVNNNRNKISDVIMVANKSTIVTPVTSKLYYETSTDTLYKAKIVENDNEEEIVWIDITGATVQYVDTNFLKKDNTAEYTPVDDYNPATKKYVDDNCVPYQPFPSGITTNSTTQVFMSSIRALNLPAGSTYLGGVTLTDMPFVGNAEVEVYIYPNNVVYCVLRSANVSPYEWECNSHTFRGWEAVGKAYADSNFLKKDNTVAYTPTGDYNPTTKKYVDNVAIEIEGTVEELIDNQISNPTSGTNIDLQDSANGEVKSIDIFGNSNQKTVILPSEYQQVDYIESTGTQYIDTNIIPDVNTKLEANFAITNTSILNYMGSALNNGKGFFEFGMTTTGQASALFSVDLGDGAIIPDYADNNYHTYYVSNGLQKVDEVEGTNSITSFTGTMLSIYLFRRHIEWEGTSYCYAKLKYCKIWQGENIVRDFIPCYRKSDNAIGLYDLISNSFFTNAGTGTFSKGNDALIPNTSYPQEIYNAGDNGSIVEKITNKNLFNDKINLTQGFVNGNSGTITDSPNYKVSDYININGLRGKTIYINWVNSSDISYALYDANKTYISGGTSTASIKNGITIPSNASYLRWAEKNDLYLVEMWSLSNNDTYTEHQEQLYTIPCQQPMRSNGDVKDTFVKETGVWYERHYIKELDLKEIDLRVPDSDENNIVFCNLANTPICDFKRNPQIFMSDYFKYVREITTGGYSEALSSGIGMYSKYAGDDARYLYFVIPKTIAKNLEEVNTWVTTNNIKIYYVAENPVDIPCTTEQIEVLESLQEAKTYKTVTHIFSEDEVPAEVDLIYYLDNETVYKNILLNYVKKTDYAKGDVGGLIKTGNGFSATSNGYLTTSSYTYPEYIAKTNVIFIGKGTLETIISSSILKTGSTAPTTSTVGYRVGQLYLNTADNKVYQLTSIDNTDPNNIIYNWQQIINNTDLANTVGQINSVLDSINGVEV